MNGPTIPILVVALATASCAAVKPGNRVPVEIAPGEPRPSITSIEPEHKVRPEPGDAVEWTFTNNSRKPLRLKIGNFRPHGIHVIPGEPWDKRPIEGDCLNDLTVANGDTSKVHCRVIKNPQRPRTYKYDIIGDGEVLLDPVIEIPPP
jgi:hypothetical protein